MYHLTDMVKKVSHLPSRTILEIIVNLIVQAKLKRLYTSNGSVALNLAMAVVTEDCSKYQGDLQKVFKRILSVMTGSKGRVVK